MTATVDHQLTFDQHRARQRGPRAATRQQRLLGVAAAAACALGILNTQSPARESALARLEHGVACWLCRFGIGAEFQAADIIAHLSRAGLIPDGIDLRAIGGLITHYKRRGLVEPHGVRMTAPSRNCNSTPRTVWLLRRAMTADDLRFAPSLWPTGSECPFTGERGAA